MDRRQPFGFVTMVNPLKLCMAAQEIFKCRPQIGLRDNNPRKTQFSQSKTGIMFGPLRVGPSWPATRRARNPKQQQDGCMAEIFGNTAGFKPASMPASLPPNRSYPENGHKQQELEQGKRPFGIRTCERKVRHPADDREGREQEIGDHPAAIGIGQIGRKAVCPGEALEHLSFNLVDKGLIATGKSARSMQQRCTRTPGNIFRAFIFLDEARHCATDPTPSENCFDSAIGMKLAMAARMPVFCMKADNALGLIRRRRPDDILDQDCNVFGRHGADFRMQ